MNLKVLLILIFFIVIKSGQLQANEEFKIIIKVENEIITNIDLINEKNYLSALNNEILNLPKEKSLLLAKNSIIKEKIKLNEINKHFGEEYKKYEVTQTMLKSLAKKIGLNSVEELKKYFLKFNLDINFVKNKMKNGDMWNRIIFKKYKNQISIDTEELKNRLKIESGKNNTVIEYNLSEIQFSLNIDETLKQKYNDITKSINNDGFKIASNLYSVSETSDFGGKIGWINKTSMPRTIINELEKLKIGEITKPIKIGNLYLILKVEDKKESKVKVNLEKELEKLINYEKNKQFNQFSLIYLNKIKQNTFVSDH